MTERFAIWIWPNKLGLYEVNEVGKYDFIETRIVEPDYGGWSITKIRIPPEWKVSAVSVGLMSQGRFMVDMKGELNER